MIFKNIFINFIKKNNDQHKLFKFIFKKYVKIIKFILN